MLQRKTIIAILTPSESDVSPVLPYLRRSGTVEVQGPTVYIDAGAPVATVRHRKKLLLLRATMQAILNVPIRIGSGSTKSVAVIAARSTPAGGITIVAHGDEARFLERTVIDLLPGIGRRTAAYLRNRGIGTIGKFARLPQTAAVQLFGVSGLMLSQYSQGADPRDVLPSNRPPEKIGRRSLFSLFGKIPTYPPTVSRAAV